MRQMLGQGAMASDNLVVECLTRTQLRLWANVWANKLAKGSFAESSPDGICKGRPRIKRISAHTCRISTVVDGMHQLTEVCLVTLERFTRTASPGSGIYHLLFLPQLTTGCIEFRTRTRNGGQADKRLNDTKEAGSKSDNHMSTRVRWRPERTWDADRSSLTTPPCSIMGVL